jgi:hypothetical protein
MLEGKETSLHFGRRVRVVLMDNARRTSMGRFKRSCIYATGAVVASTILVFVLVLVGGKLDPQGSGANAIDLASYVLGFPLLLGWATSTGIFGALGSCATPTQILGVFLVPVISIPIDTCLTFAVWEFFHRKASRGLQSDGILHIK